MSVTIRDIVSLAICLGLLVVVFRVVRWLWRRRPSVEQVARAAGSASARVEDKASAARKAFQEGHRKP